MGSNHFPMLVVNNITNGPIVVFMFIGLKTTSPIVVFLYDFCFVLFYFIFKNGLNELTRLLELKPKKEF